MIGDTNVKYDLKYNPKKQYLFGHTAEVRRNKYPINPYIPATKKARLFRDKSKKKVPFSRIIQDLEPYSLYPPEEIKRLLNFYSFFMLHYLRKGYTVDMPYFGQFTGDTEMYLRPFRSKHKALGDAENFKHETIEFRPSPFTHWYLNPLQYTPYKYQHVPTYFRTFDNFRKELWKTDHLDWDDIFPDQKYLKFSLDRIRCNGTIGQYANVDWGSGRAKKSLSGYSEKPQPKKVHDRYGSI